jgi:DNA-binding response OmpR family regulator
MLFYDCGHAVREAYDGKRALELAQAFRPHAIVLDLGMPDVDGYGVARTIRSFAWARDTLIAAFSGHGEFLDRVRSQDCGFDYHITKPVQFCDVVALIERRSDTLHAQARLLRNCG